MATPVPRPLAVIVLAAGQGTRMKSRRHKVLHEIAGKPMIDHVLDAADGLGAQRSVLVVGSRREQVADAVGHRAVIAVQEPQLGTGHAVLAAQAALADFDGDVLILYGDVPLIESSTLTRLLEALHRDAQTAAAVLAFRPADAGAYGRIVLDDRGCIAKMVEYKDATPDERALTLCNSGVMAVTARRLFALLQQVTNDNAAGEYYLPDIVMLALAQGLVSQVVETGEAEVQGVNSRGELALAEALWQQRRRARAMADGVTLIAPDTVFFSADTVLEPDVIVEPHVVFGPGVRVAEGTVVHAFSHLAGAQVGPGCSVGPYARLRPGTVLGAGVKVGNFVEVKQADVAAGAKINHLSYIGDATVGAEANIGAGTITCNYDGYFKYRTDIGAGAFIGSNSALVAPVRVGAGALVGAGSVVTQDVPDDALALTRAPQETQLHWAARFRAAMSARKQAARKAS